MGREPEETRGPGGTGVEREGGQGVRDTVSRGLPQARGEGRPESRGAWEGRGEEAAVTSVSGPEEASSACSQSPLAGAADPPDLAS